ncbi:MAG TPA: hypothetical protein VFR11_02420 [Micromonosporaceae bacterium]|jgi:hypothetical protein|nr:hypothetical protein [Micromonosporaceae bacterium]
MAKLGWTASVGLAVGASAGMAAAQFGLGYGLGIISWAPATPGATPDDTWLASLAWTVFIAATSTVTGTIFADRRAAGAVGAPPRRMAPDGRSIAPGVLATGAWRTSLAFCAAVGALLSVVLVLVPARTAVRADTTAPELIAAGYAVVGVVIGILISVCALSVRSITTNVLTSSAWLWLLAIAASIDGIGADTGPHGTPLAMWPYGPGAYFRTSWSVAGTALMFGAALVIGAGVAWVAQRRGDNAVGIALSGAIGPLTVAAAYLLTAPRLVGVHANAQISAYLTAPYAVIAGLAGSVLVVVLSANRAARRSRRDADEVAHADWPTTIATAPGPRTPIDGTPAKSGAESGATTFELSAGKSTPSRLPTPPAGSGSTSSTSAIAAAPTVGADTTGTAPVRRPSPRPRRRPGRR